MTYYFYNEDMCDETGFDNVWSHPDTIIITNPDRDTLKELKDSFDYFDLVD